MTLETLYKRAKSGAIQYWKVETRPMLGEGAQIRKESGQLNTDNPLVHLTSVLEGKNLGKKNETTPLEQAELDAASDWRKKRDEGYKTLEDLGITCHGAVYSVPGVNGFAKLEQALDAMLGTHNTDASGNVKPMLAKAVKPGYKGVKFPCFIQPKLDGVRCLMVVTRKGPDFDVTFLSRSGKPYTTLQHIADDVLENAPGSEPFILDGEIYSDELSFQGISKAVKKQRPESLKLKFRCYDMVSTDVQDIRLQKAFRIVDQIGSTHIQKVDTYTIAGPGLIKVHHDEWVQQGYEGAMLRDMNGTYDSGQRSSSLLKVKEFDETEFRAKYFYLGERPEDLLVQCESEAGDFAAKMMGTREQKQELIDEHGLQQRIKQNITIKHFGYTDDGLPRFPIGKAIRDYE